MARKRAIVGAGMRGGDTKDRQKAIFIESFGRLGQIDAAAEAAGIVRQTAYRWRGEDVEFAKAWEGARREAVDTLEQEAYKRAVAGSDVLLIFLLKGGAPEKYRERITQDITTRDETRELSDLERANRVAAILARRAEAGDGQATPLLGLAPAAGAADGGASQQG